MASQNRRHQIVNGPSWGDMMFSQWHGNSKGRHSVQFRVDWGERIPTVSGNTDLFAVIINGADREDGSGESWIFRGYAGRDKVSGYYSTRTRKGWIEFVDPLAESRNEETAQRGTRRERALVEIIFRMINAYRERHAGDLDEGMFRLFEKAKAVHYAETDDQLATATKGILSN